MDIRAMCIELIQGLMQISVAVLVTLLQRWLFELSTFERDMVWITRQPVYRWLLRARWYRGIEAIHQWRGVRLLRGV